MTRVLTADRSPSVTGSFSHTDTPVPGLDLTTEMRNGRVRDFRVQESLGGRENGISPLS